MKLLYCIFCLCCFQVLEAQNTLFDANVKALATLHQNKIIQNKGIVYNYQGGIVFKDSSNQKENIIATVAMRKVRTLIYKGIETKATWIVRNQIIYWQDEPIINRVQKDGFTSFYHYETDSLLAYVNNENLNEMQSILCFYFLWEKLSWATKFKQELKTKTFENMPQGVVAYMQPNNGNELEKWVWDGSKLYLLYDKSPHYIWLFDGKTAKPYFNSNMNEEWSWDGEEIKPFWGGHPSNNWRWEGNILRQVFENDYRNEYEWVDGIVRKRFGSFNDLEWAIYGEMPPALVALVVLGIAYR